jgi:hypothetical protein
LGICPIFFFKVLQVGNQVWVWQRTAPGKGKSNVRRKETNQSLRWKIASGGRRLTGSVFCLLFFLRTKKEPVLLWELYSPGQTQRMDSETRSTAKARL